MSVDPLPRQSQASPLSRNRSILSRFTTHFGQRNRNISDFYVQPDDPWKTYFPGDTIKGTVVLTVIKPVRITHLVICLHGYVKVFKNTIAPGEKIPDSGFLGTGRGRRGSEYLGNGFATLFEDEVVLCGDGRLKEGIYKFQFEMEFPPHALPSSINFERGTITYMLTATLTRPSTISPVMSCHKRVNMLENIDIAPFPAPKPRLVSLEPVSRRSRTKSKGRSQSLSTDQAREQRSPDQSSSLAVAHDHRPPVSPAPSDVSSSSRLSHSSQSFQVVSDPSSVNGTGKRSSDIRSVATSASDKTITATAEVLRAGALPGDTLPIKITINHSKQIRSPHGIIITLYRQGRIDMHPAIPVGQPEEGKKPIYEDVYPKSRTGLGGLSFGTTRSSSVFRKDLSQAFAPLIVDPATMTAQMKMSIRVPEDTFPTITRVPGAMISFRYYIEVVMDLRGKLAASDRFLPRLNMVSGGKSFSSSGHVVNVPDNNSNSVTANWAGNIMDTDQIRREKGVVALVFEVVVGTRDSGRHQRHLADEELNAMPTSDEDRQEYDNDATPEEEYAQQNYYSNGDYQSHQEDYWADYPTDNVEQPFQSPDHMVIPPPTQPEEPVDEKTRLRRMEEMLLPSQPPGDAAAGPSTVPAQAPTAPDLPDEDELYDYNPHLPGQAVPPPPTLSVDTVVPGPDLAALSGSGASHPPTEDKRELERQRLMAQASAPEATAEDSRPGPSTEAAPSAPDLDEEDNILNADVGTDESLPQYRR
ncbi:pH-response regulator protein palF/RIM8 [Paecilomyces variotii]|uniref:pH-response regulator protein palF/RIM8 n=1 Tax=Byssochlamys spectabilis TaxID=264951 RepID=A0A443I3S2_BYSSP|nr:pH-response regulator protein palF/RIM8 [Paecilomyces variotii]KAJ9363513.1 hypothetical protein DTO280E4_2495 [Paecilomyces variotii]RWQ98676.1 pH-response regulator protein palF/RIM8 [Paecilomyces variotii]